MNGGVNETALEKRIREAREKAAVSFDGIIRNPAKEDQINGAFRSVFAGPAGQTVLDYLRSITLNTVLPPEASDAQLRNQEGMRRLFGIIHARATSTPSDVKE